MRKLRLTLVFVFLMGVAGTVIVFNVTKPRVLVVQSYDTEYAWTRDVDVGINRIMKDKSTYTVRWFYMDTKRHPWRDYKINAGKTVAGLIERWQPTVVIAVDDDAQEFVMKNFVNRSDIRIVYSGVNNSAERYGYNTASNVTGILEKKPFAALKDTLLMIAAGQGKKGPVRIMFVGDNSESVHSDEKDYRNFAWGPVQVLESRLADTFEQWRAAIDFANKNKVDFIVTANYRKIARQAGKQELVPAREILKWTEANSKVPMIGTNAFFVEDGGVLAIATSPYEQGEVAATMVNEIVHKGKAPSKIPVQSTQQFVVAMSESGLKRWGIQLPAVYEASARSSANFYP
jgi:ABC-type uncharacterized transport system substrate-binding protein